MRFTREPRAVLFAVWDASDDMPVTGVLNDELLPDPDALDPGHEDGTSGRGLPIVAALSSEHGVDRTAPHGKWAWSRVAF